MTTVDELAQIIRQVDGNHTLGAGSLAEAILAKLPHLAARQPVGDPEIWVSPGQLEEHKRRPPGQGSNYLPTRLACEGNFTQPLYAAPAQAVDLGQFRQPVQDWLDDAQASMEEHGDYDGVFGYAIEEGTRLLALIDSQAVGNK